MVRIYFKRSSLLLDRQYGIVYDIRDVKSKFVKPRLPSFNKACFVITQRTSSVDGYDIN